MSPESTTNATAGEADGESGAPDAVALSVGVLLSELLLDPLFEPVGGGELDAEVVRLGVIETEADDGGEPLGVTVGVVLRETMIVALPVPESDDVRDRLSLPVPDGDGVPNELALPVLDRDGVPDGLVVPVPDGDGVPDGLMLLVPVGDGVRDGLAPSVVEAVGVPDMDDDSDTVVDGVGENELVGVEEEELVGVSVAEPVPELLGITGALVVGVADVVEETVAVRNGDGVPVAELPRLSVGVGVADGVEEKLSLPVDEPVLVTEGVGGVLSVVVLLVVGVPLAELPRLGVGVGVADGVEEKLSLPVDEPVLVSEGVGGALSVAVPLVVGVQLAVRDGDSVPLAETTSLSVGVVVAEVTVEELTERVGVPRGHVGVALSEAAAVAEAIAALHCVLLISSQGSLLPGTTPKARTSMAAVPPPAGSGTTAAAPLGTALDGAAVAHRSIPPCTPQKAAARGFKPLALVASSAAARTSLPAPPRATTSVASALPAVAPLLLLRAHAATMPPSADSDSRVLAVMLFESSRSVGEDRSSSKSWVCVESSTRVLFVGAAVPRPSACSVTRRGAVKSTGAATRRSEDAASAPTSIGVDASAARTAGVVSETVAMPRPQTASSPMTRPTRGERRAAAQPRATARTGLRGSPTRPPSPWASTRSAVTSSRTPMVSAHGGKDRRFLFVSFRVGYIPSRRAGDERRTNLNFH